TTRCSAANASRTWRQSKEQLGKPWRTSNGAPRSRTAGWSSTKIRWPSSSWYVPRDSHSSTERTAGQSNVPTVNFELSPELAELQQSVRRLAQDKVKPRAREIDESNEYPQDLFEIFRDAGLLGLVVPTEYGGSGGGILGLAIAIEEVAKYSNSAALMLLLTRLPTGPVLIAGSEHQKHHYVAPIAAGAQRAAFG